ncbi:hypothetical protein [Streptomyces sp. Ru62]|nr:hypothetical protein [Streptomyces sp. Ru62]
MTGAPAFVSACAAMAVVSYLVIVRDIEHVELPEEAHDRPSAT